MKRETHNAMNYFAWMVLAIAGGLGLTAIEARRRAAPVMQALDVALVALAIGVIGARAGYVAINWNYFANHFDQAIQWWYGGLLWHTGLMSGLVAAVIYARYKHWPARDMLDLFAPGLALGCSLGWLACYTAHCAYGIPVWPGQPVWFLAADLPDAYGLYEPRVAVQLPGAGWSALVAGCLLLIVRHPSFVIRHLSFRPGARFALFVCLYSAGMFALGFLRGDEMIMAGGLRLDQWVDIALAIAGAAGVRLSAVSRQP